MDALVDEQLVSEMRSKGYSRIPVFYGEDKSFIIGILIVKTLIGADVRQEPKKTLRQLWMDSICIIKHSVYVTPLAGLGQVLNIFKSGSAHMAVVCTNPQRLAEDSQRALDAIREDNEEKLERVEECGVIGITTLEKVLEDILNMQILDEKDLEKMRQKDNKSVTMHHDYQSQDYNNEYMGAGDNNFCVNETAANIANMTQTEQNIVKANIEMFSNKIT